MRFLICFLLFVQNIIFASTVYISPFQSDYLNDAMFSKGFEKFKQLANENGYEVHTIDKLKNFDDVKNVIVFNILNFCRLEELKKRVPKERLILFIWEPPTVSPQNHDSKIHEIFGKIYTWEDDLVDKKKYFKFYYPSFIPYKGDDSIKFEDKKLCTFIFGNHSSNYCKELYTERRKVLDFFENLNSGEFEFYGRGWWKIFYKNYKGTVTDKIECLKKYKFCICYENTKDISGYVTEKIFDCMAAGCVPIYWGANNIEKFIPKECFVDRRKFKDTSDLYNYLKSITKEQYKEYITNIKQFLKSEKAQLFTFDNLNKTLIEAIR